MSNNYDSMAGSLSDGTRLGNVALGASVVAATVWPDVFLAPIPADKSGFLLKQLQRIPVKNVNLPGPTGGMTTIGVTNVIVRLFMIRTDTGMMCQACSHIHESGNKGLDHLHELNNEYYSIRPTTWQANDQEAYSEQLRKYRDSVLNTYALAWETALLTSIVAVLRFIQLAVSALICGILAIMAGLYWATVFIPPLSGFAQAVRTAGTVIARFVPTIIRVMDEAMVMVGYAHAGLIGIRTGQAAISDSIRLGNGEGFRILGGAGVEVMNDFIKKISKGQVNVLSGF